MHPRMPLLVLTLGGVLAGCGTNAPIYQLRSNTLALDVRPDIDRAVSFRAIGGPEVLFTADLDEPAKPDEQYTFYGGAYSWTAPQNGDSGWIGPDGALRAWPPDPAMDVGPAEVVRAKCTSLTLRNPENRLGLVEHKSFALTDAALTLTYILANEGDEARTAGTWINTAVHRDAVLAVRLDRTAANSLYGWNDESIDRFRSLARLRADGWALLDLSNADWEGGIKVYVARPEGERPTIAIWHDGVWFQRVQRVTEDDAGTVGRLKELGEGAVAVYIQPAPAVETMIVEAELYGPIVDLGPGEVHEAMETWTIIPSRNGPDTSLLEVPQDD